MLDVIEFQIQFIGMSMRAAVLGAVVCEHVFYIQILSAVKRQYFIMKNGCSMGWYLARVDIRKSIRAIRIHNCLYIHFAYTGQAPYHGSILTQ